MSDVRMRGFAQRADVDGVLALISEAVRLLPAEVIGVTECAGRLLAADVTADCDVPGFARSAMDGYALLGEETFGASAGSPIPFTVAGEARPGRPWAGTVARNQAVRIMTGAPLPAGADAVLRAEAAREEGGKVLALEPVTPGRHVGSRGEDVRAGSRVLSAGRRLRPQDAGLLASIGRGRVEVIRRPQVDILVTGDELLQPGARPRETAIVDSNSVMLAALVRRDGGRDQEPRPVADTAADVRQALADADGDVVLVSGGSSVGREDHVPGALAELGELAVHGVAIRPASPAGFGFLERDGRKQLVFLLPGNPVSCLCAYDFFAGPAVRGLGGLPRSWPYPAVELSLARKITSVLGRVDYVRVRRTPEGIEPLAVSGASILSSTVRADGFVVVSRDDEGHPAGATVTVHLYDSVPAPLIP